jgi:hypothetical protein
MQISQVTIEHPYQKQFLDIEDAKHVRDANTTPQRPGLGKIPF